MGAKLLDSMSVYCSTSCAGSAFTMGRVGCAAATFLVALSVVMMNSCGSHNKGFKAPVDSALCQWWDPDDRRYAGRGMGCEQPGEQESRSEGR